MDLLQHYDDVSSSDEEFVTKHDIETQRLESIHVATNRNVQNLQVTFDNGNDLNSEVVITDRPNAKLERKRKSSSSSSWKLVCSCCFQKSSTTSRIMIGVSHVLEDTNLQNFLIDDRNQSSKSLSSQFVRSQPHINGNWAGHVYITMRMTKLQLDMAELVVQTYLRTLEQNKGGSIAFSQLRHLNNMSIFRHYCMKSICHNKHSKTSATDESVKRHVSNEFHISLSRAFYLQYANLKPFVDAVTILIQNNRLLEPFCIRLQSFSTDDDNNSHPTDHDIPFDLLMNDEGTRIFLVWRIDTTCVVYLKELVTSIDAALRVYQQQPYYSPPIFHISFASHAIHNNTIDNKLKSMKTWIDTLKIQFFHNIRDAMCGLDHSSSSTDDDVGDIPPQQNKKCNMTEMNDAAKEETDDETGSSNSSSSSMSSDFNKIDHISCCFGSNKSYTITLKK